MSHTTVLSSQTCRRAENYLQQLQQGAEAGQHLRAQLEGTALASLSVEDFLVRLIQTKQPQIFAESEVHGDGRDWNREELAILGDIGMAVPVMVFDDGQHRDPIVHAEPIAATLLFIPGALLTHGYGLTTPDQEEVVRADRIDPKAYNRLYARRLLPLLRYADEEAARLGKAALVTIPGIGCGMFAGAFRGELGCRLEEALVRLIDQYGSTVPHIRVIYFDPYAECENRRRTIGSIELLTRPLTRGNAGKSQLALPERLGDPGDDFSDLLLFSIVAWDQVSWPGNDFYGGARATDDGVKAAATDSMRAITGITGRYDPQVNQYLPPAGYTHWEQVVSRNRLQLNIAGDMRVYTV